MGSRAPRWPEPLCSYLSDQTLLVKFSHVWKTSLRSVYLLPLFKIWNECVGEVWALCQPFHTAVTFESHSFQGWQFCMLHPGLKLLQQLPCGPWVLGILSLQACHVSSSGEHPVWEGHLPNQSKWNQGVWRAFSEVRWGLWIRFSDAWVLPEVKGQRWWLWYTQYPFILLQYQPWETFPLEDDAHFLLTVCPQVKQAFS